MIISSSCESFLDQEPMGGTMVQSQYDKVGNAMEGTMRGVYSMMYATGTRHDAFGHRAIDMYGDLLCGDMALTSETYGWFSYDEHQETRSARSSYIWSYNYNMLRNINKVLSRVKTTTELLQHVEKYGFPDEGMKVYNEAHDSVIYHYNEEDSITAIYYAQALTMRGYVYSNLLKFYTPTVDHIFNAGANLTNYRAFPIYTEDNMDGGAQDLAIINDVYNRIDSDLTKAIDYFEAFGKDYVPSSKLIVDVNVARGMLAYFYLNRAREQAGKDEPLQYGPMRKAITYATQVINSGKYKIIPNEEVLYNGFNSINNDSWMWGQRVTIETVSGLASFFGQVDIHSYSYAWAGDTKAIDKRLYESIPAWDIRKRWFNDGSGKASYALCPDKKFFSSKNPNSTSSEKIDREWLSDNVFMRIESMYLIAAEACYFIGKQDSAVMFLTAITDQRVDTAASAATQYAAFKASLSDDAKLVDALFRNWRVELWGEGYGLQTFRRLTTHKYNWYNEETDSYEEKVRRGSNHIYEPGAEMSYKDETKFTFQIPASETNYNPYLRK